MLYNKHYKKFYDVKMKKIKENDIIDFIININSSLKDSTKHSIVTNFKTFFNWYKKIISDNVFRYIDSISKEKRKISF